MISANCEWNVASVKLKGVGENWRFKAARLGLLSVSACWRGMLESRTKSGGVYNQVLTPGCSLSTHHHLIPPHYYLLHWVVDSRLRVARVVLANG